MRLSDRFVSACVVQGDIETFFGINKELLLGETSTYSFVADYFRSYGELPSISTISKHFGTRLERESADPRYLIDELRREFVEYTVTEGLSDVASLIGGDPYNALNALKDVLSKAQTDSLEVRDTKYSDGTKERYEAYQERKKRGGISYVSTGDPLLDSKIFGWGKTDLVTIGGRSGIGKTWIMLWLALALDSYVKVLQEEGKWALPRNEILFVSNEMNETELAERMDCVRCVLPYPEFLAGMLNKRQEKKLRIYLRTLKLETSNIRFLYQTSTLDELRAKIKIYDPLATFVDGSYLLHPELDEGFTKAVFITRGLKKIALDTQSPVINSTQLRKNTGKAKSVSAFDSQDEFYYGSIIQDSDIAFKAYQDADLREDDIVALEVAKGRRMKVGDIIHWKMDVISGEYYMKTPEEDEEEEATKFATTKKLISW